MDSGLVTIYSLLLTYKRKKHRSFIGKGETKVHRPTFGNFDNYPGKIVCTKQARKPEKSFEWGRMSGISFCRIKTRRCQLKRWKYWFIKKNKFELHLRITNITIKSALHSLAIAKFDGLWTSMPMKPFKWTWSRLLPPPRSVGQVTCCLKPSKSKARVFFPPLPNF